jgi:hypothetical protein
MNNWTIVLSILWYRLSCSMSARRISSDAQTEPLTTLRGEGDRAQFRIVDNSCRYPLK